MAKKQFDIDPNERVGMHTRMSLKRYMYVARLASMSRHGSMQKILDDFFPTNWEKEAEILAEKMRKLGYKDWAFYPPKLIKRLGIKATVKTGRRRSKAVG